MPQPSTNPAFDTLVEDYLETPGQLLLPSRPITPAEVWREINRTSPYKAPGYDLITGKVLKELPRKAYTAFCVLDTFRFNGNTPW